MTHDSPGPDPDGGTSPWARPTEPVPQDPQAQPTQPVPPGLSGQPVSPWGQPTVPSPGGWAPPTVPVAHNPYQSPPQGSYQQDPAWAPQPPHDPRGAWGQPQPPGWPAPPLRPARPQRLTNYPQPARVEVMPDAGWGLAILPAPVTVSGVAIGSMTAGIGSLLVSGVVWCFGLMGAQEGWGGLVGGAFCVLAVLLGIGSIGLGWAGLRQIRRGGAGKGRGYAITGIICGGSGILLAAAGVVVAIAMAQNAASGT